MSSQMCVGATQLLGSWSQVGHLVCRLLLLVWWVEVGPFVVELASGAYVSKEVWAMYDLAATQEPYLDHLHSLTGIPSILKSITHTQKRPDC